MPIKGFTDRPRLIRGGKLRLGIKVKKTNKQGKEVEYPQKIDYFRFDPNDPSLLEPFQALYGEQPKALPIAFPSNSREDLLPHALKLWKGRKVYCHGDGEQGWRLDQMDGFARSPVPCPCPLRFDPSKGQDNKKGHPCVEEGTLRVLLPELPTLHLFEMTVHKIALLTLITCLDRIEGAFGQFMGIPLTLSLKEETANFGGQSSRIYTPYIDAHVPIARLMERAQVRRPDGIAAPALPQGGAVLGRAGDGTLYDPETGEILEEEPPELEPDPAPADPDEPTPEEQVRIACEELIDTLPRDEQGRWRYQLNRAESGKALWDLKAQLIAAQPR